MCTVISLGEYCREGHTTEVVWGLQICRVDVAENPKSNTLSSKKKMRSCMGCADSESGVGKDGAAAGPGRP